MSNDVLDRRLEARLATLPSPVPGAARAERVRARCHAQLSRRANRVQARRRLVRRVVAPILVGGFCAIYFVLVLYSAFGTPRT